MAGNQNSARLTVISSAQIYMDRQLLREAAKSVDNAYAPYSRTKVAAALRTKANNVFVGVNVEAWPTTLGSCAEANAVAAAVKEEGPLMEIDSIAVYSNGWTPATCGGCCDLVHQHGVRARLIRADGEDLNTAPLIVERIGEVYVKDAFRGVHIAAVPGMGVDADQTE
jgi:cytidine deaminase